MGVGVSVYLAIFGLVVVFFCSSRRRHTRLQGDWSSDVCSSDLRSSKFVSAFTAAERRFVAVTSSAEESRIEFSEFEVGGEACPPSSALGSVWPLLFEIGRARVGKECRSRWSPYH